MILKKNILNISITLSVCKLDKFNSFKERQLENILSIFVTLIVFKPNKFNEVKEIQSENIFLISITFFVSKLDKSKEIILLHELKRLFVFFNNLLKINLIEYLPSFSKQ